MIWPACQIGVLVLIIPGLTAMVKHDDPGMIWNDHGDLYSP